jgi:hypothetical protein
MKLTCILPACCVFSCTRSFLFASLTTVTLLGAGRAQRSGPSPSASTGDAPAWRLRREQHSAPLTNWHTHQALFELRPSATPRPALPPST